MVIQFVFYVILPLAVLVVGSLPSDQKRLPKQIHFGLQLTLGTARLGKRGVEAQARETVLKIGNGLVVVPIGLQYAHIFR